MTEQARMTIGKLAKQTGVSTDAIRFYETEKILLPAGKSDAGYRLYDTSAVQRLAFVKQAQHCGMTLSEIKQLLELKADGRSCCSDVRSLAVRKKLQLEHKIETMKAMSQTLGELIKICTAEDQPLDACPILAALDSPVRASR
jgi:DNA-binding transcriptional MerR regulator